MTREEAIKLLVNATYSDEWQGNEDLTTAHNMSIKALEQEPRWIPVSERLPDIDEEVLVDDGLDIFVAWWVDDGFEAKWHSFDGSYSPNRPILAWMSLPEPYKAESEV